MTTAFEQGELGFSLTARGRIAEAIQAYQAAVELEPNWAEAHFNLGIALRRVGRLRDAIEAYQRAIACKPGFVLAYNNLGNLLRAVRQADEAVEALRTVVTIDPAFAEGWNNLGAALKDRGELDGALACFDRAIRLAPGRADVGSNRIYLLHFMPEFAASDLYREQRNWADAHLAGAEKMPLESHERSLNRRLRIGFVSPNFRDHCQIHFTLPLLRSLKHGNLEVFCYSDVELEDEKTAALRQCAAAWREIFGKNDRTVANEIVREKIDILVDLTQHMGNNRLGMFAMKPAQLQVAWLGYPGGTGVETMDFRLTDPHLEGGGAGADCNSERAVCLPDTFWCYDPASEEPEVNDLPALAKGFVTFGCLNNFCKVNDGVMALWSRVLREIPDSRLILQAPRGKCRERVIEFLAEMGVDEGRISFADFLPRAGYLELYHQIDIGLDTLPYSGHTTSLDSLWMGVPVVTRVGATPVGRAGLSLLSNLELGELVGASDESFVEIACELAGDLKRVAWLRAGLRKRMRRSALMDVERFARAFELACWEMWRGKTENRPP